MGVQDDHSFTLRDKDIYIAMEFRQTTVVMTIHEFMGVPRSIYYRAKLRVIGGEDRLVDYLKERGRATH